MRWCHGSFSRRSAAIRSFFFVSWLELLFLPDFHFHSFAIITPSSVSLNLFFMLILITTHNTEFHVEIRRQSAPRELAKRQTIFWRMKSLNKFSLNLINFFFRWCGVSWAVVGGGGGGKWKCVSTENLRDLDSRTLHTHPANYVLCVWLALLKRKLDSFIHTLWGLLASQRRDLSAWYAVQAKRNSAPRVRVSFCCQKWN